MDLPTFIVELVKALAWPVSVIVISVLFRDQLNQLLKRLKRGKVGPAEFEFAEGVRELQAETVKALPSRATEEKWVVEGTMNINPREAVISAWAKVENQLTLLAKRRNIPVNALHNTFMAMRELERTKVLTAEDVSLLSSLRALRNAAAHEPDFNPPLDSVLNYLALAAEALKVLEDAAR